MADTDHRAHRRESRGRASRVEAAWADPGDADLDALARDLRAAVEGDVRVDGGSRALYATDASNYRQVPIAVVIPRTVVDVERAVGVCRRHGAPILPRGCGTSLAGQGCNTAVVIDFSRHLDRVLGVDPVARTAQVEPGVILDILKAEAETHRLTVGPDPATHDHCTLGGMIGNNSCGVHSVMGRRTADNVVALDVLTVDGVRMTVGPTGDEALAALLAEGGRKAEIFRALDDFRTRHAQLLRTGFPDLPRRVSGYADLDALLPENGFDVARALVGTEATCVLVLGATVRLIPSPPARALALLGFPGIGEAADEVPAIRAHGPIAIEALDDFLVDAMHRKGLHEEKLGVLPEGCAWLVVEFGGESAEEAGQKAQGLIAAFEERSEVTGRVVADFDEEAKVWKVRQAGLPASAFVPERPLTWEGWEDTAVPVDRLGGYVRALKALLEKYGYVSPMYGHFGDGLVHCRISFDQSTEEGVRTWHRFLEEAADLVVAHGGSLSGEHGDGQARAEFLTRMYSPAMIEAFREFKAIWDPGGLMNPGKVVDAYPATSNLRHGPTTRPEEPATFFAYETEGGFVGAAERCVGVGKCRRLGSEDGVMCPSFMVTREERHSTRGRARLLYEMLKGDPIKDGWRSEEVEDALKLCLACKGCKSDCPVQVDMATYKAEFRAHYYRGRLRPRAAYSMGLIHWWARAGSAAPWLANFLGRAPGVSAVSKAVGGIAQERTIPRFAREDFRTWFRRRGAKEGGERIVLWPDTFNTYLRPDTLIAATRILEGAGYSVTIPARPLCCGRPLYGEGMLPAAMRLWRRTFETLREEIARGTPVVGVEPSCVSAFRDELPNLFPKDEAARALVRNTHFFCDFVTADPERFGIDGAGAGARALVQVHCNHHAVLKDAAERRLLERMGVDYRVAPSGCCGMAGSFGFAAETYAVGQACGERAILPMVRAEAADTVVLADGFSCREQIEQGTGRPTLHVAEFMARRLGA